MSAARKYDDVDLPYGWRMVRLGDLIGTNQGGTPRKEETAYWDGNIPFLTGADLTDFRVGRNHARSFLTEAGLDSGQTTICEPGTLLLATRTRVGLAGIVSELMGASQDITCLYPNEQVNPEFLCRSLLRLAPELQRLSRGTTIQGITREDVCSVPILLPTLAEQRAIADVLDSIDEAIERTEAVIAATETLRDSLLHELLTRGVPGWHTEWKDVPGIGTIPADWEVVRLGAVLNLDYGVSLPERDRRAGEVPVVGSAGVVGFHSEAIVEGPGVVVGRKGSIGSVTWMDDPFVPIDTTYFVTPKQNRTNLRWLYYLLGHENLSTMNRATGVPGLNRDDVYSLRRAIPCLHEQRAISATLDSVDERVYQARAERDALITLRASVAEVLLTGRARLELWRIR